MSRPADRYRYQEILWGEEAQARIRAGRVGVFGVGGTGAAHAHLLARAGVGYLRLIDRDVVEMPDLHRTHLFDERDALRPVAKAVAAARRLAALNAEVRTDPVAAFANADNVTELASGVDVLVDGSDNFRLRFLLNEVAVKTGRPLVYQGAEAGRGAVMAVVPGVGPCLRCLRSPPEEMEEGGACARVGVSPTVIAATASVGAGLTLALLRGEAVAGRLSRLADGGLVSTVTVRSRETCPVCGRREFAALGEKVAPYVGRCCGGRAFEVFPGEGSGVDLGDLASRLPEGVEAKRTGELLWIREGEAEAVFFADGRALIYGARDEAQARARYDRLRGDD